MRLIFFFLSVCTPTKSASTILAPGISLAAFLILCQPGTFQLLWGTPHLFFPLQFLSPNSINLTILFSLFIKLIPKEPQTPENIDMTGDGQGCLMVGKRLSSFVCFFFFKRQQEGTWLQKHKQSLIDCDRLPCQYKLMCFTGCLLPDIDSV